MRVGGSVGGDERAGGRVTATGALGVGATLVVALELWVVELVEYRTGLGRVVERRIFLCAGWLLWEVSCTYETRLKG